MELNIKIETSSAFEDHGLMIFEVDILDYVPLNREEMEEAIQEAIVEKIDFDELDDEEIADMYCEINACRLLFSIEPVVVGHLRILKQKCNTYSYRHILSQGDNDKNLFDVVSYFFAPSCNETTGDEVAAALSLPDMPQSGQNRDNQTRGLIGAYLKKDSSDDIWEDTIAYEMFDNGEAIDNIWYIDEIYIKPPYRGKRYGIYATALFLHKMIGCELHQVVAAHPSPLEDLFHGQYRENPQEGRQFALHYLCEIFKDKPNYDPDVNILWLYYYQAPTQFWQNGLFCD